LQDIYGALICQKAFIILHKDKDFEKAFSEAEKAYELNKNLRGEND
jgi:hypothetical protein